jgi:hypothetical protein
MSVKFRPDAGAAAVLGNTVSYLSNPDTHVFKDRDSKERAERLSQL